MIKASKTDTIFSPCCTEAVNVFGPSVTLKAVPGVSQMVHISGMFISSKGIAKLYTNQLAKYANRLKYSSRFMGQIVDVEKKIVSKLEPLVDDFRIRGSDGWFKHRESDMKYRMRQSGRACLKVSFSVPLDNPETIASWYINKGFCLTATYEGDFKMEQKIKYMVHLSHKSY